MRRRAYTTPDWSVTTSTRRALPLICPAPTSLPPIRDVAAILRYRGGASAAKGRLREGGIHLRRWGAPVAPWGTAVNAVGEDPHPGPAGGSCERAYPYSRGSSRARRALSLDHAK